MKKTFRIVILFLMAVLILGSLYLARETTDVVFADEEGPFIIYLDVQNAKEFAQHGVGIYAYDSANRSESEVPVEMQPSDKGNGIYEYTLKRKWKYIAFTSGYGSWEYEAATMPVYIDWEYEEPCFVLAKVDGTNTRGVWRDLSSTIYFDASFIKDEEAFLEHGVSICAYSEEEDGTGRILVLGPVKMKKSEEGEDLYEYTMDSPYSTVQFLLGDTLDAEIASELVHIDWTGYTSPCYRMTLTASDEEETTEETTTEEETTEEETTEEETTEEETTEETTTEEETTEEETTEETTTEEATTEEETTEEATTEEETVEEETAEKTASEEATAEEGTAEKTASEEATAEEKTTEEKITEEIIKEAITEQSGKEGVSVECVTVTLPEAMAQRESVSVYSVEKQAQVSGELFDIGEDSPQYAEEAAVALPRAARSTTERTIYFDSYHNTDSGNGWTADGTIYISYINSTGLSSSLFQMTSSVRTRKGSSGKLWEYSIPTDCIGVIFSSKSSWATGSNHASQTVDVVFANYSSIGSNDLNLCFALTDGGYEHGTGKKTVEYLGDLGPESMSGETLYFYDMSGKLDVTSLPPKAVFRGTGITEQKIDMQYDNTLRCYSITVPSDENSVAYDKVQFSDQAGNALGDEWNFLDYQESDAHGFLLEAGTKDTFYYSATEKKDGTKISRWGKAPTSDNASLAGKTLYFNKLFFPADKGGKLRIGNDPEIDLSTPADDSSTLCYTFPADATATQQTLLTFIDAEGTEYHFKWTELTSDRVTLEQEVARVAQKYVKGRTIYYDATFSKLSYQETQVVTGKDEGILNDGKGIPYPDTEKVYYYATNENGTETTKGSMIKLNDSKYPDVYMVDLEEKYTKIRFAGYEFTDANAAADAISGDATDMLTIPDTLQNPCFYGDTSDDVIYKDKGGKGGNRGGYWDKVFTIRDPQQERESKNLTDKIVDIPEEAETKDNSKLYLKTTFYDFYSDYELNGDNRDTYPSPPYNGNNTDIMRLFQPFRQFNQALSSYYEDNSASSPLYWGQFQNYTGYHTNVLLDIMQLYGSKPAERNKFYYENNSAWAIDGSEVVDSDNNKVYNAATTGLVSDTLGSDGNLMIKTKDGSTVTAPFLNEDFLGGNNSKNAVLGQVYHDVSFPFYKVRLTSSIDSNATGSVDYWVYDSSAQIGSTNKPNSLRMQYDKVKNSYYLAESTNIVGGRSIQKGDFFPFNNEDQSGNAGTLNYGFAVKFEIKFRLPEDGMVRTDRTDEKIPIEFNFLGDDDVWIYIDGKLALDLGGAHDMVNGYLNFANKEYTIKAVKSTSGHLVESDKKGDFWMDPSKEEHTLTMFYMERGLYASNMKLLFNFMDESELNLKTEVDDSKVNTLFTGMFDDYEFPFTIRNLATHFGTYDPDAKTTGFVRKQIEIRDYRSATSGKLEDITGAEYYVIDNDTSQKKTYEDPATNKMKLKNGSSALFADQFRKGSYISLVEGLSDPEKQVFSTSWTMYEGDEPVTAMAAGSTIALPSTIPSLKEQQSASVEDGRTEKYQTGTKDGYQIQNAYDVEKKPSDNNTFVFRSYRDPDSESQTKLKVVYTNEVKTGTLTIRKEMAAGSWDITQNDYTFEVIFTNVAGLNLEGTTPVKTTFTLKPGGEQKIEGIPINTQFTIQEIATDESTVESVTCNGTAITDSAGSYDNTTKTISGTIQAADGTNPNAEYTYVVTNMFLPVVDITVSKKWLNADKTDCTTPPADVTVQLQRRASTADSWANVDGKTLTLTAATGWIGSFTDLEKYIDVKATPPRAEWEYRVVEVDTTQIPNVVIEQGEILNHFQVSYGGLTNTDDASVTEKRHYSCIITNTHTIAIDVVKQDKTSGAPINDVIFRLEKKNADDTWTTISEVTTGSTGTAGVANFPNITYGSYRLTEVKTASGYTLLKEPIPIELAADSMKVNGQTVTLSDNKITITIQNMKNLELPATGGNGFLIMMVAGMVMQTVASYLYLQTKERKENQGEVKEEYYEK